MVGWLKSNWLIVVFAVLILVIPAAAFVVSGTWNTRITTERAEQAAADLRRVQGASVTYRLPPAAPGEQPISRSGPPNRVLTEWFRERRAEIEAGTAAVVERAAEFNRRGHGVLVDGLFPAPASRSEEQRLGYEFVARLLGRPDRPGAYDALMGELGAVGPVDGEQLAALLTASREREIQRLEAERGPGGLSAEEESRLQQVLIDQRKGVHSDRARSAGVYADRSAFLSPTPSDGGAFATLPSDRPTLPPTAAEAFGWQWNLWVLEDIVAAVAAANEGPDGFARPIASAPIKRVESIAIAPLPEQTEEDTGGRGRGRGSPTTSGPNPISREGRAPTDDSVSITGRLSHPSNTAYDIRRVRLRVVAAGDGLDALFAALSRVNFMTVLSVRIEDVSVWDDLSAGYYYGPEPVVRAEIEIETVWLRSWVEPLMPGDIASAFGVQRGGGEL